MTDNKSDDSLQLIENDITECILEKTITDNNLGNINNNLSKLSKNIKKIEMNEINFPNVNSNFENFEIIEKKPVNFVLDDNKRGTNKINVKNTSMNLQEINSIFDQYKINEKNIQNNNDELKINSNEQKINSNEPKTNSNEIKINSNESKIIPNELNPNEQKINSNEQKINPDNSKIKDLYKKNNKIKRKGSYSCLEEEEEEENENNQSNLIIQNKSESNIELQNNEFLYEILQEKPNKFNLFFKIILVGDFGVGKTSLINNSFKEFNLDNGIKEIYIKIKEQIIKVQIYDTYEQEKKNNSLNSSFYNNSSLAILVYSIDNKKSFKNINKWLNEIKSNNNKDIKIFLIGNKIDLNNRKVTKENGEKFKNDNNLDLFLETSAIKNNNNKENIFIEAIKQLFNENRNKVIENSNDIIIEPSNNNQIKNENNKTEESCCERCYKNCILF